mgnify:FL=1
MTNCNYFTKKISKAGFLVCFLLSSSIIGFSQEFSKIGFDLKAFINEVPEDYLVPILVEANSPINETVNKFEGNIRLQVTNLYSLEIPAKHIIQFSREEAILLIEFDNQPGKALSDTMLVNVNADSIVNIMRPLTKPYSGKGVLVGVIDSGIEINHGDFKDTSGNTRILYIWDQRVGYNPNKKPGSYSYGIEWDSSDINSGVCTHDDKAIEFGHGSMVTGAAVSNANATGTYGGVAPDANIIAVATDFNKPNWLQTVAEAVDYIYKKADTLRMPCVINASIGTYKGSHDGKDIAARMIDLLIKQKNGRSFVCAAGNAGHLKFHLRQAPQNDIVFTWFERNPALFSGFGGIYFEAYSDTNDFSQMQFAIGADRQVGNQFEFRGRTNFTGVANKVNQVIKDSVISKSGNLLAYVDYYVEQSQGRYKLEVAIIKPDSVNYLYRLETAGTGLLDVWSSYSLFRSSDMKSTGIPSPNQLPDIVNYVYPDSLQTIVSSFTCLPSVITVGNYINRNTYLDFNGNLQNMGATPREISDFSSLGPNRNGFLKPDIFSAGDFMMSSGRIATMLQLQQIEPNKISQDGMHMRNGGTSMASPTLAGMVALYFEMCKNASHSEVKNKLLSSAKTDNFTTGVPDPKWGVGKADAFQYLVSSNFVPNLNYGSSDLCGVDSINLSTLANYNNYLWNNNDTTSNTNISTSGTYYAYVTNNLGCQAKTDEIDLNFYQNPVKPLIIQTADTLSISGIGNYQWFLNSNAILGSNQSNHIALQSGDYHCELIDTLTGCRANSDTINVLITNLFQNQLNDFNLFPNPSTGQIQISGLSNEAQTIEVYSMSGALVFQEIISLNSNNYLIDLKNLKNGVYFITVKSNKGLARKRIILQ